MTSSTRTAERAEVDKYIDRLVAEAPPLDTEQRDRLAVLLNPARSASALCDAEGSP
ncbi:hypothetical protein [Amycolatopsis sp. cmx-11-51]|uniref:hypothetical protein n=1 Tax=Amycolatopsis sp. cmx-11-51 TaxID=2785797 RepID=UPI0039E5D16B